MGGTIHWKEKRYSRDGWGMQRITNKLQESKQARGGMKGKAGTLRKTGTSYRGTRGGDKQGTRNDALGMEKPTQRMRADSQRNRRAI